MDLEQVKYVELTANELDLYRLKAGDILFNRTNSKDLVGKCETFDLQGEWVFASYLMRLTVDRTQALPRFVVAYLNGPGGRAQIERDSRQIIGMTNINAEEIRALRIPLPPDLDTQAVLLARLTAARVKRDEALKAAAEAMDGLDAFILDELGMTLPPKESAITPYAVSLHSIADGRLDPFINKPWYKLLLDELEKSPIPRKPLGSMLEDVVGGATPDRR